MVINTIEEDNCRILVLNEEGKDMGTRRTNVQNGPQSDSPDPAYVDGPVISHSYKSVDHMDISDPYPPCVVTVDIEKGSTHVSKINHGSIKTDIPLTKALRRQKSLDTGVSIPPLMNHILMLLKFDARAERQGLERSHDGANNRWRKCKRPSLLDSRRIVVLFSILSSMGTVVLIYLTLRVRQVSDGNIHA